MGRPAKPTALKLIDGNPGKRKIELEEEVSITTNLCDLDTPEEFNEEEAKIWEFLLNSMPAELFKSVDMGEVKIYCVASALHKQAHAEVKRQGMVVASPVKGEPMQNPYLSIMNRQAEIMMRCAASLGFTPTARAKMTMPDKKPKSSFDDL